MLNLAFGFQVNFAPEVDVVGQRAKGGVPFYYMGRDRSSIRAPLTSNTSVRGLATNGY
jgi:hypothetical protein